MNRFVATVAAVGLLAIATTATASAEPCALADKAAAVQRAALGLKTATTPEAIDAVKKEVVKSAAELPPMASLGEGELSSFFDDYVKAITASDRAAAERTLFALYSEFSAEAVCAAAK